MEGDVLLAEWKGAGSWMGWAWKDWLMEDPGGYVIIIIITKKTKKLI